MSIVLKMKSFNFIINNFTPLPRQRGRVVQGVWLKPKTPKRRRGFESRRCQFLLLFLHELKLQKFYLLIWNILIIFRRDESMHRFIKWSNFLLLTLFYAEFFYYKVTTLVFTILINIDHFVNLEYTRLIRRKWVLS